MSSFPPKQWAVRYLCDMDQLECTASDNTGISMEAFLAVKLAGGEEGSFRFTLGCAEKIKLRFHIEAVLPSRLFAVKLMKNSVCTEWMDVAELVQSQDMIVRDGLGDKVSEEFLTGMASYRKDLLQETGSVDRASISFRWLIGNKKGETEMLLMAQVKII